MDKNHTGDVLNWQEGVDNFSGDEEMFKNMLSKLEKLTLDEYTTKLYQMFTEKNWAEFHQSAHSLRGLGGYVAAEPFKNKANELREKSELMKKHNEGSEEVKVSEDDVAGAYVEFLKEAIRLKKYLANLNSKQADVAELERQMTELKKSHRVTVAVETNQPSSGGCCTIF
mmetsp:Transcript_58698/g.67794  ORF Transcript_58698/g.67794 Transcript_58698/m.67794 type:complete len:170 (-) Transcript_58698:53-562(-)